MDFSSSKDLIKMLIEGKWREESEYRYGTGKPRITLRDRDGPGSFYFLIVVLVFSIFLLEFFSELKKLEPADEFIPILFFPIVLSSEYKQNHIELKDRLAASMLVILEASKYMVMHATNEKFSFHIENDERASTSLCLRFLY